MTETISQVSSACADFLSLNQKEGNMAYGNKHMRINLYEREAIAWQD